MAYGNLGVACPCPQEHLRLSSPLPIRTQTQRKGYTNEVICEHQTELGEQPKNELTQRQINKLRLDSVRQR